MTGVQSLSHRLGDNAVIVMWRNDKYNRIRCTHIGRISEIYSRWGHQRRLYVYLYLYLFESRRVMVIAIDWRPSRVQPLLVLNPSSTDASIDFFSGERERERERLSFIFLNSAGGLRCGQSVWRGPTGANWVRFFRLTHTVVLHHYTGQMDILQENTLFIF